MRTITRPQFITDDIGRLIAVRDPLGNETTYEYDGDRIISLTDSLSQTASFEYDAAGRLIRQNDPDGGIIEFTYDALGREISETRFLSTADPSLQRTTTTTYRADGLIAAIADANGSTTQFEYDLVGNQIAVIDPLNQRTEFTYDELNRQTSQVDPIGNTTTFGYDAVDNLIEIIDRNSRRRTFNYDSLDQLTQEIWWEGDSPTRNISFGYDAVGNLILADDLDSTIAFTYNSRDRVSRVDYTGTPGLPSVGLNYSYDGVGNITSVTDNFGVQVSSTYDARDLLTQQLWQGTGIDPARVDYTYNSRGDRTAIARYADLTANTLVSSSTFDYDDTGRLTAINHLDGVGGTVAAYNYTLNSAGELVQELVNGQTNSFSYDQSGQLISTDRPGIDNDERYSFDANGNRVSSSLHGDSYLTELPNRITSDGIFNYDYDNEGNLIRRVEIATNNTRTFEWDFRNRLVAVVDQDAGGTETQRVEYAYDVLDRRIAETVNGVSTYFINDGNELWAEVDGAGAITARYLQGAATDERIARYQPGEGTAWYLTDRLGSVRDTVDASGNLINHIDYDSFGNILIETNPDVGDRFGFAGREFSDETGIYYNRARYYDPQLGSFISEDPIGFGAEDPNLYRYVGNNPINATDPSGLIAAVSYAGITAEVVTGETGSFFGAFVGFFQGFGTTSLVFIDNILDIANNGGNVLAEYGTAIERTEIRLKEITEALKEVGSQDSFGIAGGFINGNPELTVGVKFDIVEDLNQALSPVNDLLEELNAPRLELPDRTRTRILALEGSGFIEGYQQGLIYLRTLDFDLPQIRAF